MSDHPTGAPGPLALEPRIMYDAAGLVSGLEGPHADPLEPPHPLAGPLPDAPVAETIRAEAARFSALTPIPDPVDGTAADSTARLADPAPPTPRRLVVLDGAVDGWRGLAEALPPEAELLVLDPTRDGLAQISAALALGEPVDSLEIVSHGEPGALQLGSTRLDAATLAARAGELQGWGERLAPGADLLLYGCDVGQGDTGAAWVERLSGLTGADVAASDDPTGSPERGGDLALEVTRGPVDQDAALASAGLARWHGLLRSGIADRDGAEFPVNTTTTDHQWNSSVAPLKDGGFVVIWNSQGQDGSDNGVFGQRFDSGGGKLGEEFQVNQYTTGEQMGSSVSPMADGGFMITWDSASQDGSGMGVYARRYDAAGTPVGNEFAINEYTLDNQQLATIAVFEPEGTGQSGNFLVVWQSLKQRTDVDTPLYDLFGRLYTLTDDGSGNKIISTVGDVLEINENAELNQVYPVVTTLPSGSKLPDGGYLVAWTSQSQDGSGEGIYARAINYDGTPAGPEFQVNEFTISDQSRPALTALKDGGFVVTWASLNQRSPTSGWDIYGSLLDDAFSSVTGEFQINSVATNDQKDPAISALGDGGFIVVWSSFGEDGSGRSVHGQRFSAGGYRMGDPFQVNTYTPNYQDTPAIATLSDSRVVVTWQSAEQDRDLYGIFGQIFITNNAPTLDTWEVSRFTTIDINDPLSANVGDTIPHLVQPLGLAYSRISDVDYRPLAGIAVVGADTRNGHWEYSLDDGANWTAFGTLAESSATLLDMSDTTRIRFVPDAGFTGDAWLRYRAWDQTQWRIGDSGRDTTDNGGMSPFSIDIEAATIQVDDRTNVAPTLDPAVENVWLPPILENSLGDKGELVRELVAAAGGADLNVGQAVGLAITRADNRYGSWQFSLDGGASWQAIDNPGADPRIPALAVEDGEGWFVVADPETGQLSYTADGLFQLDAAGYLVGIDNTRVMGKPVPPPEDGSSVPMQALRVADASNLTRLESDWDGTLTAHYGDGSSALVGQLAIAAISDPGQLTPLEDGYLTGDAGVTIGAAGNNGTGRVLGDLATLLAPDATTRLRFIPNGHFYGYAAFEFHAWDQSAGENGQSKVSLSRTGDVTPFGAEKGKGLQQVVKHHLTPPPAPPPRHQDLALPAPTPYRAGDLEASVTSPTPGPRPPGVVAEQAQRAMAPYHPLEKPFAALSWPATRPWLTPEAKAPLPEEIPAGEQALPAAPGELPEAVPEEAPETPEPPETPEAQAEQPPPLPEEVPARPGAPAAEAPPPAGEASTVPEGERSVPPPGETVPEEAATAGPSASASPPPFPAPGLQRELEALRVPADAASQEALKILQEVHQLLNCGR